jgi:hypothetical protein
MIDLNDVDGPLQDIMYMAEIAAELRSWPLPPKSRRSNRLKQSARRSPRRVFNLRVRCTIVSRLD